MNQSSGPAPSDQEMQQQQQNEHSPTPTNGDPPNNEAFSTEELTKKTPAEEKPGVASAPGPNSERTLDLFRRRSTNDADLETNLGGDDPISPTSSIYAEPWTRFPNIEHI
jgi:hypothetical protein